MFYRQQNKAIKTINYLFNYDLDLYMCFLRGSSQFSYVVSEPLGRNTYKERYLFLYRYTKVKNDNTMNEKTCFYGMSEDNVSLCESLNTITALKRYIMKHLEVEFCGSSLNG